MTDRDPNSGHPHDELAVYALGALPADEAAALEDHLLDCQSCQERLRWLTPAVDEIPASVPQQAAPPALRERLMAVVDAEADVPRSAPVESGSVASSPRRRWLPSLEGLSLRPALAGLAVVLLLVGLAAPSAFGLVLIAVFVFVSAGSELRVAEAREYDRLARAFDAFAPFGRVEGTRPPHPSQGA